MRAVILATSLICGAAPVAAEPVLGMWQTEADRKGQVAHVDVHHCDQNLCGRIVKAFNAQGERVVTPNVDKLVFWGMEPTDPGEYEGRAWVPAHDREYKANMELSGDRLKVAGCVGPICQSQIWKRVD